MKIINENDDAFCWVPREDNKVSDGKLFEKIRVLSVGIEIDNS